MIQRIQSLYMLIISVLSILMIFNPVAGLYNNLLGVQYELTFKGLMQLNINSQTLLVNSWALSVITALIPVLSFLIIFLFKNRLLQIRLSFINIVLMAGYYGILFIYLWQFGKLLDAEWFLKVIASFPLINIILNFMAIRAIGKDIALLKSLNRIR